MTNVVEIPDDVWFSTFWFQTPCDLCSISQTCTHFHDLCNVRKNPVMNKFWKYQCQEQWIAISKHKCCNSAGNYSCPIGTKNYNFLNLFKIMVNFIVKAFYMKNHHDLRDW